MINFDNPAVLRFTDTLVTPRGPDAATRNTMDALQQRLDRQHLIIQALLVLLLEKKILSEEELNQWVAYVDGLDGRADGRLSQHKKPQACPACGRNNAPEARDCMYCGRPFQSSPLDPRARGENTQ